MKDFGLFAERDITCAERIMDKLERYADRRERFVSTIDLESLDCNTAFAIEREDEEIAVTLAEAHLYLNHLCTMAAESA